jgi:hypothetical protein
MLKGLGGFDGTRAKRYRGGKSQHLVTCVGGEIDLQLGNPLTVSTSGHFPIEEIEGRECTRKMVTSLTAHLLD